MISATDFPNKVLTGSIIGAALEVHRFLGRGYLESVYHEALMHELSARGLAYEHKIPMPVIYKGHDIGVFRLDFLIEGLVVVELKATSTLIPADEAQLLNYLKCSAKQTGLLLNFGALSLQIKRMAL